MKMNKIILLISIVVVSLLIMHSHPLHADTERDPDIDIRLRFAIVEGNTESIKNILEQGADANVIYSDGVTPLADAITRSRAPIDVVKVLIQHGADPTFKSNGLLPLSLAKNKNDEELIDILRHYIDNDMEFYELAVFYLNKEKEVQALYYTDEALKLNPFNAKAWALKGSLNLTLYNNKKDAAEAYHKALEASLINLKANRSRDDYNSAVWYALLSSDFTEALRVANEGLSLFPEDGNLRLSVGYAMLLLGRKEEAIASYKKAYADLQRSGRYADQAGQVTTDEYANLISRYPDKASELKWAEEKVQKTNGWENMPVLPIQ